MASRTRDTGYISAYPVVVATSGLYGSATGGIGAPTAVTINSVNYEYLTFNATGTLTIIKAGFFDFCAIGGGGGCQSVLSANHAGGAGGGGQVVFGSIYLSADQTITIGAGSAGSRSNNDFGAGEPTSIAATSPFTQTALGNLSSTTSTNNSGTAIYVGGGAGSVNGGTAQAAFTETVAIGFRGGNASSNTNGGGGGGQSGRGGNGTGTTGGTGGTGVDVSVFIGGSALYKAQGGGGGGTVTGGTASTGGVAGSATTTPPNGSANTGQGGAGGSGVSTTGNGGSGICYIRYTV